jgi:succinylarginine dihydrolase
MLHETAFAESAPLQSQLLNLLGEELVIAQALRPELPIDSAVLAYPFNSQVLTRPDGAMVIVAPEDSREDVFARAFLERVASSNGPVQALHYIDVRQSMQNGGGPACLRLRVALTDDEALAVSRAARVVLDDALYETLCAWVDRFYRDRLAPADLADPSLAREGMEALDQLTTILRLGSVYDFQLAPGALS